ncbi:branched-chain amino acid ABC transporter permease [soil metagenome]
MAARWHRWAPWIVLTALIALPFVMSALGQGYYIGFARRVLIVALAATALNFMLGHAGMVALGHAGFMGVGAYALVGFVEAGWSNAWLLWGAAIVVSASIAALIGIVAVRTRGVYFIMITLAFAQMLYFAAVSLRTYGGDDGYTLYERPALGLGLDAANDSTLYWVVLAIVAVAFWLFSRAADSRFGQALMGIRENETRMRALGFPVQQLRFAAFVATAAIAGLAGALLAAHNSFVSPSSMHWTQSATLVVMLVIGGIGHRWGGFVGATVWLVLEEVLRSLTDYWHWPLGVLLLVIVFFAPRGLTGLVKRAAP